MSTTGRQEGAESSVRDRLISAGIEMLEAGEPFSLRGAARRVGVSQTAPYRHFRDKEHLKASMAARGYRVLYDELEKEIRGGAQLERVAQLYVRFSVKHPELYHLMFGQPCGENDERLAASAAVTALIEGVVAKSYPGANSEQLAIAGWALAHGLASLHLAGKIETDEFETQVAASFKAILQAGRGDAAR